MLGCWLFLIMKRLEPRILSLLSSYCSASRRLLCCTRLVPRVFREQTLRLWLSCSKFHINLIPRPGCFVLGFILEFEKSTSTHMHGKTLSCALGIRLQ